MSKPLRTVLIAGGVLLILLAFGILGHRSRSQVALQAYKAQLRAKGEKLTFQELKRAGASNSFDSAAILTNAVANFAKARFHPGNLECMKFVGPAQVPIAWKQERPPWSRAAAAGAPVDWPELAASLDQDSDALDQIRQAMKEPPPDWGPRTNVFARPVPNFIAI